jgi:acylphosphatase
MKNVPKVKFHKIDPDIRKTRFVGHNRKADGTVDIYEKGDEAAWEALLVSIGQEKEEAAEVENILDEPLFEDETAGKHFTVEGSDDYVELEEEKAPVKEVRVAGMDGVIRDGVVENDDDAKITVLIEELGKDKEKVLDPIEATLLIRRLLYLN